MMPSLPGSNEKRTKLTLDPRRETSTGWRTFAFVIHIADQSVARTHRRTPWLLSKVVLEATRKITATTGLWTTPEPYVMTLQAA